MLTRRTHAPDATSPSVAETVTAPAALVLVTMTTGLLDVVEAGVLLPLEEVPGADWLPEVDWRALAEVRSWPEEDPDGGAATAEDPPVTATVSWEAEPPSAGALDDAALLDAAAGPSEAGAAFGDSPESLPA